MHPRSFADGAPDRPLGRLISFVAGLVAALTLALAALA